MLSIGGLFEKIRGIQAREMSFRTSVCDSVQKQTGMSIEPQAVSCLKGRIVIKNISHSAKSVIFMKKAAIIEEVNKLQDIHKVNDIS